MRLVTEPLTTATLTLLGSGPGQNNEEAKAQFGVSHSAHLCSLLHFGILFPGGSDGKASAYNAGNLGLIPGLGRSPGEGNGNPLQYSCLENPMDGGAW